ncbi:MAG TPA: hypothetical protein VEK34_16720 [Methylocella sp.]|nr:hypothetical protein [Methylocella sp.]
MPPKTVDEAFPPASGVLQGLGFGSFDAYRQGRREKQRQALAQQLFEPMVPASG